MRTFADLTLEQLLSLLAGIVGVVMMAMAMHRDQQSDRDRQDAHTAESPATTSPSSRSRDGGEAA